jgi:hypothetical protein
MTLLAQQRKSLPGGMQASGPHSALPVTADVICSSDSMIERPMSSPSGDSIKRALQCNKHAITLQHLQMAHLKGKELLRGKEQPVLCYKHLPDGLDVVGADSHPCLAKNN